MHIQTHQSKQVYPCDTRRQSLSFSPALLNIRTQKHTRTFSFASLALSLSQERDCSLALSFTPEHTTHSCTHHKHSAS